MHVSKFQKEFEHDNHAVCVELTYEAPNHFERMEMAPIKDEELRDHLMRVYKHVVTKVQTIEMRCYKLEKGLKLEDYKKKSKKEAALVMTSMDDILLRSVCKPILNFFGEYYCKGIGLGED